MESEQPKLHIHGHARFTSTLAAVTRLSINQARCRPTSSMESIMYPTNQLNPPGTEPSTFDRLYSYIPLAKTVLSTCKGARYLCCTTNHHFMTTNSINCDEATFQASRIVTLSQINSMYRHDSYVTSIQMSTATVTCWKQNKLPSYYEEDKLLHPCKMSKSSHNTCKYVLVFIILSYLNIYARDQALSKHFIGTSILL